MLSSLGSRPTHRTRKIESCECIISSPLGDRNFTVHLINLIGSARNRVIRRGRKRSHRKRTLEYRDDWENERHAIPRVGKREREPGEAIRRTIPGIPSCRLLFFPSLHPFIHRFFRISRRTRQRNFNPPRRRGRRFRGERRKPPHDVSELGIIMSQLKSARESSDYWANEIFPRARLGASSTFLSERERERELGRTPG